MTMKHILSNICMTAACALMIAAFGSCDNKKFRVGGAISEAKDSVLYFENMSLDGPVAVDSVKLGGDGSFSFSGKAPEAPEFYRLRIAGQIINLSVDSTETITVKAAYPTMATAYTVEGSAECATIKELALKQIDLLGRVIAVERSAEIGFDQTRDSVARMIEAYKQDIKMNYIYKAPMRASEYYAARFAAKEAFSKALGTGINGFSLTEIEIAENEKGKPYFILSGRAEKLAEGLTLHLSMSHERDAAVAMVVAEDAQ